MPSGRVHTQATLVLICATSVVTALLDLSAGGWVIVGEAIGLVVTPDLDLTEARRGRARGLARLWRLFWWPYGKMFGHRGISHAPIVGTLTRLLYIAVILGIMEVSGIGMVEWVLTLEVGLIALGLVLADLLHVILDAM